MFRQWLRHRLTDWACSYFGHHWWVISGVTARADEDGVLGIFGKVMYGDCKRCGAEYLSPRWTEWMTHTVRVTDVSMVCKDGTTEVKVDHEVEELT